MSRKPHDVKDLDLWHEVAKSVRPMGTKQTVGKRLQVPAMQKLHLRDTPRIMDHVKALPRAAPQLASFDRRTEQRLLRGQAEIDARLDLHGLGLEQSRSVLLNFISSRRMMGARLVLVITGKGASAFSSGHTLHGSHGFQAPERQGRLRREVPNWLHEPQFRDHVIGFQQAHPKHGGGGALYVRLRRVPGPDR